MKDSKHSGNVVVSFPDSCQFGSDQGIIKVLYLSPDG